MKSDTSIASLSRASTCGTLCYAKLVLHGGAKTNGTHSFVCPTLPFSLRVAVGSEAHVGKIWTASPLNLSQLAHAKVWVEESASLFMFSCVLTVSYKYVYINNIKYKIKIKTCLFSQPWAAPDVPALRHHQQDWPMTENHPIT